MKKKKNKIPAIPPDDYKGTIADWITALITTSLWDGQNPVWYGDVCIPEKIWWQVLEDCEEGR